MTPLHANARRRPLAGPREIEDACAAGLPIRAVFVARSAVTEVTVAAAVERARRAGARIHVAGDTVLERFGRGDPPPVVLGVTGPPAGAGLREVLSLGGAVWLLAGVTYPTNVGYALRTAEVSGADGVVVDGAFAAADRRTALRASMRADRVMPVIWGDAATAVSAARATGVRVVAVEDCGTTPPWQADLTRPSLLVLGGERRGIPSDLLALCDEIVRVPMAGFIPSYNVQAAMAAVAVERLRQLGN
jgi:tRNA G18 (ribose-2'-O)-methylase SpoU